MKPWVKAGLIGSVIALLFTVLSLFIYYLPSQPNPAIAWLTYVPFLFIYPGIGYLAAFWLASPRTFRQGGRTGSLAGLVTGGLDGFLSLFLGIIVPWIGRAERHLQARQILQSDGELFSFIAMLLIGQVIWVIIAVLLGGIGGLVCVALTSRRTYK